MLYSYNKLQRLVYISRQLIKAHLAIQKHSYTLSFVVRKTEPILLVLVGRLAEEIHVF